MLKIAPLTLPFWVPRTPHDNIAKSTRVNLSRGPPDPPRHFRQEDPGGIVMQGFPRMSSSCFRLRHFFSRERRFLKIGLLSQITFKSLIQFRLEGREVNLFIHPPTSRSPAPAASTGSNISVNIAYAGIASRSQSSFICSGLAERPSGLLYQYVSKI